MVKKIVRNTCDFIEKANLVHNNYYSYGKTNFVRAANKVVITCPKHGDYEQIANTHLSGSGCNRCALDKASNSLRWNNNIFINRAREVHGNKYNYSLVDYQGANSNIIVICPLHGQYSQLASVHLRSHGCPTCGYKSIKSTYYNKTIADRYKEEWSKLQGDLYVLRYSNKHESFIKIGISKDAFERTKDLIYNSLYNIDWIKTYSSSFYDCVIIEQNTLAFYKDHRYFPLNKFSGYSECIHYSILDDILNRLTNEFLKLKDPNMIEKILNYLEKDKIYEEE